LKTRRRSETKGVTEAKFGEEGKGRRNNVKE
jgi:hypothetical protein